MEDNWEELGRCIADVPPGEYRCADTGIYRTDNGKPLELNDIAEARLRQLKSEAEGTTRIGLIAETGGKPLEYRTRFYWVVEQKIN